jgi:putative membrane protein
MSFLTAEAKAALTDAVASIEERSSAEVVVLVRPQSGRYRDADLTAGIAAGLFTLWFQLFSPWEFSLASILVAPVAVGAGMALLVSRAPGPRRWLTREAGRREAVLTAARAAFLERGVDRTRARTGILVYLSLLEREAEVVPDRGIQQAVPPREWDERVAALQRALRAGEPGSVVAGHLRELGAVLAVALPRGADDTDELGNEVVA